MMIGTADEIVKAPEKGSVFVEDLPEEEQVATLVWILNSSLYAFPWLMLLIYKLLLHIEPMFHNIYNNNNNQAFYSQASWGSLEMKSHEPKQNKSEKKGKTKGDKKPK
jgi:hypothetical protein